MQTRIPIFYLIYKGWEYAGRCRPAMVFYLFLFIAAQLVALAEPWVIGKLLNSVQTNEASKVSPETLVHNVIFYLTLYFGIQVVFWVMHGPARVIEMGVQYHIKANFKAHLFQIVTDLPLRWHREHHSGDSIDKINRACTSLGNFFDNTFEISYMLVRFIGAQIVLFFFMTTAGWTSISTTIVAFAIIFLMDTILYRNYITLNKYENRIASAIHDYVTNIVSVITLRLEDSVLKEVKERLYVAYPLYKKHIVLHETKWFSTAMMIALMVVLIMFWYTKDTLGSGKVILAGTFFTLFEYLRRIGDSFYNFAGLYGRVVRQAADVQSADTLVETHRDIEALNRDFYLPTDWKKIEINELDFTYEDEQHRTHHLEKISIELEKGKSIAFVGESGSGKSTLLNLIRGTHQTDKVRVLCDDKELPGKLMHLSHHTTLMPQDPEIFSDTIRFNITFGFEEDESEVIKAVELARFMPVLERLPAKLETNIAEKGVNLSGGEKQRLALARGINFANKSDIVLMDEPTSSVDTYNERLVYTSILQTFADKCVISSIHKLHLLELFDHIYVFEQGRLVESGTFTDLIAGEGVLARMWQVYQATNTTASSTSEQGETDNQTEFGDSVEFHIPSPERSS